MPLKSTIIILIFLTQLLFVPISVSAEIFNNNKLLSDLSGEDKEAAKQASRILIRIATPEINQKIVSLADNSDPEVRGLVAETLGEIGDPSSLEVLLKLLEAQEDEVRLAAASALAFLQHPGSVDGLLTALERESEDHMKSAIVVALFANPDTKSVGSLFQISFRAIDSFFDTADDAVEALIMINNSNIIGSYLKNVDHKHPPFRAAAITALGKFREPSTFPVVVKALKDENEDVRRAAIKALGGFEDNRVVPILAEVLRDDPTAKEAVLFSLAQNPSVEALPYLVDALSDSKPVIRRRIARRITGIKDYALVPHLIAATNHSDEEVASSAILSLGKFPESDEAKQTLLGIIRDTNSLEYIGSALFALHYFNLTPSDTNLILKASGSNSSRVRKYAAWCLGKVQDKKAESQLIKNLSDSDQEVRIESAKALENYTSAEMVQALDLSIKSDTFRVAAASLASIGSAKDANVFLVLKRNFQSDDAQIRSAVATGLGNYGGDEALELLKQLINDYSPLVRASAVDAVSNFPVNQSNPLLFSALRDISPSVRETAAKGLYTADNLDAVQPLIQSLSDRFSDVAAYSARSLGKIGDKQAIPYLDKLEFSGAWHRKTKKEALDSLESQ